jgi:bleomycin hydrolase
MLTKEVYTKLNKNYNNKKENRILAKLLPNVDIFQASLERNNYANTAMQFSNVIPTLPITNQKQSGRCWLFAGLNVLREIIAKKYNLDDFELSQSYLAFYDKLEKINFFLNTIDELFSTNDNDDRTLQYLLAVGVQDGGQWDMFISLVEKYGVVPKTAYEESVNSSVTRPTNMIINLKLREYVGKARELYKTGHNDEIQPLKEKTLSDLYSLLVNTYGKPSTKFDLIVTTKSKVYINERNLNPIDFYKSLEFNPDDYVSIINSPTEDKPFYKTYTVKYLGNVAGGRPIKYLNLPMDELVNLVKAQILDGEVVWFGSDVSSFGSRTSGFWDDNSFDSDTILGFSLNMDKADTLTYNQSRMNHAMVICGINIQDDQINRYKIQNSWGAESGQKGYFVMSKSWFDRFVYQAVINKKYLSEKQLKAITAKDIVLRPWDPMGSLAD